MAISESIESTADNSAAIEAQTPEPPPGGKRVRTYTLSDIAPGAPSLRIRGRWLWEAGFETGMRVKVTVMHGALLVEPLPIPQSSRVEDSNKRRSWANPNATWKSWSPVRGEGDHE